MVKTIRILNYEWRLPLWDQEYIKFWTTVPLKYKVNQKLCQKNTTRQIGVVFGIIYQLIRRFFIRNNFFEKLI